MIIKPDKQIIKTDHLPPPRIVSRLKVHPSLTQQTNQQHISNLFQRKSSQSQFIDLIKNRRKRQDDTSWRSRIQLKPIILFSGQKQVNKSSQKINKSSQKINKSSQKINKSRQNSFISTRSDRKLLIRNKSNQRKQKNLKNLLSYSESKQQVMKIKQIASQINQNNINQQPLLQIQQQFYQQVRILQAFKQLNLLTK